MNARPLIIVGIDPGTTLGYAVLDFEGNVLDIGSSKLLSLDKLIRTVTDIGKVVLVGTDKKIVPSFISNFGRKTGAKVVNPEYDLKVIEKKQLSYGYSYGDYHQMDALASSLFAFQSVVHLVEKIDNSLNENLNVLRKHLIENVILKEKSVGESINDLTTISTKVKIVEKKVSVDKIPSNVKELKENIRRYEKDFRLMKRTIINLEDQVRGLIKDRLFLEEKISKREYGGKNKNLVKFKEKREVNLHNELNGKNQKIKFMENEINKLNYLILNLKNKKILKKLKNLGIFEYNKMNIDHGELLLVEDISVISDKVLQLILKNENIIISTIDKNIKKPFIVLDREKFKIMEVGRFGLVDSMSIDNALRDKTLLNRIIEDYQATR